MAPPNAGSDEEGEIHAVPEPERQDRHRARDDDRDRKRRRDDSRDRGRGRPGLAQAQGLRPRTQQGP